jgi:predicted membrane metal-binding protein
MSAINPQLPWDLGFQLSFSATLGLVLYAEPLPQVFERLLTGR